MIVPLQSMVEVIVVVRSTTIGIMGTSGVLEVVTAAEAVFEGVAAAKAVPAVEVALEGVAAAEAVLEGVAVVRSIMWAIVAEVTALFACFSLVLRLWNQRCTFLASSSPYCRSLVVRREICRSEGISPPRIW